MSCPKNLTEIGILKIGERLITFKEIDDAIRVVYKDVKKTSTGEIASNTIWSQVEKKLNVKPEKFVKKFVGMYDEDIQRICKEEDESTKT